MQMFPSNSEERINMFIVGRKKKNTFPPNLNTGNNRISCHFLQASLQLQCASVGQRVYVCVCMCTSAHEIVLSLVRVHEMHACVGEDGHVHACICL